MAALGTSRKAAEAKAVSWEALTNAYREKSDVLRAAQDNIACQYEDLEREKRELREENGGADVSANDMIEINAGGELVVASRGTLTQIDGTTLAAIFSGRWEKKILRDGNGHVFLDVNATAFRCIVDYLNELKISSPDSPVYLPVVDDENKYFLDCLVSYFGLKEREDNVASLNKNFEQHGFGSESIEEWHCTSFSEFPKEVKDAFEKEKSALKEAQTDLAKKVESFRKEKELVRRFFGTETTDDIVHLNVSGVKMSAKRSTLGVCPDSMLAKQFNDPKWDSSSSKAPVHDWDSDQVVSWAEDTDGIPKHTVAKFKREAINGRELLAMERQDFKDLGIHRTGTLAVLMGALNELKRQHQIKAEVFIEQSPYCIGKIVDTLRLRALQGPGFALPPPAPYIRESEKARFKRVLDYYFPGELSSFIQPTSPPAAAPMSGARPAAGGFGGFGGFGAPAAAPTSSARPAAGGFGGFGAPAAAPAAASMSGERPAAGGFGAPMFGAPPATAGGFGGRPSGSRHR